MSNIFYLPRVHSVAGAKLYFRAAGTSTPQNTYSDIDLTTANPNPMVADSDGYFDPIYLDPSLPNYRVIHTDGSNVDNDYTLEVLLEPILDDIPASQIESRTFRLRHTTPDLIFEDSDASSGNKIYRIRGNGNALTISLGNDAESSFTDVISITRSGTAATDLALSATSITLNGSSVQASGSFTGTQTGYSASLTPTIQYRRSGSIVTLSCNAGSSGTSNSTGMTLTGMPAGIRPLQAMTTITRLTDNGTVGFGVASIGTDGTITFGNGITGGSFTGSGTKGLPGGWSLMYEAG